MPKHREPTLRQQPHIQNRMHKPHPKTKNAKTGAQQHLKNLEPALPASTPTSVPLQQLHISIIKLNKQFKSPIIIHLETEN